MTRSMNKNVEQIQISGIRQFMNRIASIKGLIPLTIGQPDFPTPEHIKQAAIRAIEQNYTTYTQNAGTPELRQAVHNFMKEKYDLHYDPQTEIIITNGASQAIDTALRTILSPGNDVLLPSPVYPGYAPIISQCGATLIYVDTTETAFKVTIEQLEASITENTTCLILSYPSNPTGMSLDQSELEEIASFAKRHDLFIIADEIYSELTYGRSHVSLGTICKERTIVINGLSKSHSMTGWRIGVLLSPEKISAQCLKVHQYNVSCASSISQMAAVAAFSDGINDAIPMKEAYARRKSLMGDYLRSLNFTVLEPDGAFYFLAGIPTTESSYEFAVRMAEEAKVGVIPGTAFDPHGEGYIRLSYACSEENIHEAFRRLRRILKS